MRNTQEFFKAYNEARMNLTGTWQERMEAERKMFADWYNEAAVGDRMHIQHWSDVSPCTVIKRTATTITVRVDKAELDPTWKPEFVIGGFSAHCTNNNEQRWNIEEDPNGEVETFRWHKRDNCFMNHSGEKLLPGWVKYYDYNF